MSGDNRPDPGWREGELRTFAGDSATAQRSAGQHAHPRGRSASSSDAFPRKVDGFLTRFAILCVRKANSETLYGHKSSQDSEKDSTCGT